ncbi:Uncharacterised protein [Mycobacteroides abscessus subsp. abscessus]|nr:Uncharacterised protein [Mycobacteroides abscessus subsp. abscessus]SKW73610.1 Uncharacterised protein [Mycobacteroides abscessus subsp. abscessus]
MMFWYVTEATVFPKTCWSFCTTNDTFATSPTSSTPSMRPTRTPAILTSSPSRRPNTSETMAWYGVVEPATSRRRVT